MQGDDNEAAELFNTMMRKSVRLGLLAALEDEVCEPRYHPDSESDFHRAGSEIGSAYINGTKETITRPRVRHSEEGEVELQLYKAARNQRNLFAEVVSVVNEGMSTRSGRRSLRRTTGLRQRTQCRRPRIKRTQRSASLRALFERSLDLKGDGWLYYSEIK